MTQDICVVDDLGLYLGFPIHKGRVSARSFNFVVDKVRALSSPTGKLKT